MVDLLDDEEEAPYQPVKPTAYKQIPAKPPASLLPPPSSPQLAVPPGELERLQMENARLLAEMEKLKTGSASNPGKVPEVTGPPGADEQLFTPSPAAATHSTNAQETPMIAEAMPVWLETQPKPTTVEKSPLLEAAPETPADCKDLLEMFNLDAEEL